MGDTLQMIEQTYGHLARDADEWELERLIVFDNESVGPKMDTAEDGASAE